MLLGAKLYGTNEHLVEYRDPERECSWRLRLTVDCDASFLGIVDVCL